MTKYKSARDEIIGTFDFETLKNISDIGAAYEAVEEHYPKEEKVAFYKRFEKEIYDSHINSVGEEGISQWKEIQLADAENETEALIGLQSFMAESFILNLAFDMTEADDDEDEEELEDLETEYREERNRIFGKPSSEVQREIPILEWKITLKDGTQIIKEDHNDLGEKGFIKSLGIDLNDVESAELTDLI